MVIFSAQDGEAIQYTELLTGDIDANDVAIRSMTVPVDGSTNSLSHTDSGSGSSSSLNGNCLHEEYHSTSTSVILQY